MMQYRTLGKTGWQVSVLGFGSSPLGGVFGTIDEPEAIRAVHQAFDGGVNFVDVSPYYGITKAETVLGKSLTQVSRDRFYLSTKVGRYGHDEFDFSAERVTHSIEESLQRLQVSHIDLILCHDIEFVDLNQVIHDAIPALREVQEQGKVRAIGISGLPLKIYREVMAKTELDAVLSYCHYTLNDDTLLSLIPPLQAQNIGIVNAAPLAMGLLSGNEPPPWHPASPELKAACSRAAEHCRSKGADLATLAVQFSLSNPNIATTLIGMGDTDQVKRNLVAASSPPNPTLLAEVSAILAPVHNQGWQTGRPENNTREQGTGDRGRGEGSYSLLTTHYSLLPNPLYSWNNTGRKGVLPIMIARSFAALLPACAAEMPEAETLDRLITHLENGATLLFVRRAVWVSPDWFTAERLETHLELVLIEQANVDVWNVLPEVYAVALYFPHDADTTLNALTMNTTARMLSERLRAAWEQTSDAMQHSHASDDDWDESRAAFIGQPFFVMPIAPLLAGREIEANLAELNELLEIIVNRQLTAQFQPIVSLKDGQVFGYEALIRGPKGATLRRPGMMFHAADKARMVAWYDLACIEQVFAQAAQMGFGKTVARRRLLFVNMDAEGLSYLELQDRTLGDVAAQFGLSPAGIVLEVTERQAVEDFPRLSHYLAKLREEGFRIAIDDAGAGYSSLQAIAELRPDFVKIARDLVRELDENGARRALLGALVQYARRVGTIVLAEGAETRDELAHLIGLGIPLGQGFLMGKPADDFRGVPRDTREFIQERVRLQERAQTGRSIVVGSVASRRHALPLHTPLTLVAQKFARNVEWTSLALEEDGYVRGLITRDQIGFALNDSGKVEPYLCPTDALASGWMQSRFLMLDEATTLEDAARLVAARSDIPLGSDLVVTRDGNRYVGLLSIRNLLSTMTEARQAQQTCTDALTGLPSRVAFEQVLRERFAAKQSLALIRMDIPQFETFNRCLGIAAGDSLLKTWAHTLRTVSLQHGTPDDFLVHLGGDDFVLLTTEDKADALCQVLHSTFAALCKQVHLPEHLTQNAMETEENGTVRRFPLLTLTTGVASTSTRKFADALHLLTHAEKGVGSSK